MQTAVKIKPVQSAGLSVNAVSILMAFALALWELYFFWIAGQGYLPNVDRVLETYLLNRIGYTLAWICLIYLSYQLISIPFSESNTLLKVFDGMSSLLPLGVVTIALVRPAPNMGQRYDEALFLVCVCFADLIGTYIITTALNRRRADINV